MRHGLHLARGTQNHTAMMRALLMLSFSITVTGDSHEGKKLCDEGLGLARQLGNRRFIAEFLPHFASIKQNLDDVSTLEAFYQQGLEEMREIGDLPNLVLFLESYAYFLLYLDRLPESKSLAEEYLDLTQTIALRLRIPGAFNCLGVIENRMGHHHRAYNLIKEGYERMGEMGIIWVEAMFLSNLGKVTIALGDYRQAEQHLKQSLQIGFRIKSVQNMIFTLIHLAELRLAQGQVDQVAEWLGLSLHHSATARLRQKEIKVLLEKLQNQLPADEFAAALERGKTLDLTEVVQGILTTL